MAPAYIWESEPSLTIEDLIYGDPINKYGCEGHTYSDKTLRNWVKDLCPNRQPGRRPKPGNKI